jgi:hypothetical protein
VTNYSKKSRGPHADDEPFVGWYEECGAEKGQIHGPEANALRQCLEELDELAADVAPTGEALDDCSSETRAFAEVIGEVSTRGEVSVGDMSTSVPRVDKSPTRIRAKSVYRDAKYVREIVKFLRIDADACARTHSSVMEDTSSPTHRDSLSTHTTMKTSVRRAAFLPWWESKYVPELARRFRRPAQWRDATDQLRVLYAHWALKQAGPIFTINLRLNDEIEALARSKGDKALGWLHERVRGELSKSLGRVVDFYLTMEEEETETYPRRRLLHLHGEFALLPEETSISGRALDELRKSLRHALRRAGGEWPEHSQFQCKIRNNPDEGWASYAVKEFWRLTPGMRKMLAPSRGFNRPPGFRGQALSMTLDVRKRAEELYAADRQRIMRAEADCDSHSGDETHK